jgi:peptidoglycan-N-acetylglucosamine deacetylase
MRIHRKKEKAQSKKIFIILTLVATLIVTISGGIYYLSQSHSQKITAPTDEKYYFTDSRYSGIRSKFVTRNNKREKVSIEYPITENKKINRTVAETVDKIDNDFRSTVLLATVFDRPMTETISYQITHKGSARRK